MMDKFIERFSIDIGQDAFRIYDVQIGFCINDHYTICKLKDFKDWINTIYDSNGDRSEKSYEAKKHLDMFFNELLHPWMKLPSPKFDKDSE